MSFSLEFQFWSIFLSIASNALKALYNSTANTHQELYNSITHWISHRLPMKPLINHLTSVHKQPAKCCNIVTWNSRKRKNVTIVPFWTLKQRRELKFNCGRARHIPVCWFSITMVKSKSLDFLSSIVNNNISLFEEKNKVIILFLTLPNKILK